MESVVTEHETALLRYATRILGNGSAAEDVVQNVFVKLFNAWPDGMHATDRLKYWLYRVTHNEAVDHIRREERRKAHHERAVDESDCEAPAADVSAEIQERRRLVLKCVSRLKPAERQVVLLRLQEGLSYEEISEVTGRSVGNVGNLIYHAVRNISRELKTMGVRS